MKKHKFLGNILSAVSFLLIFVLLVSGVSFLLYPKDNTKAAGMNNPNAHGFMSEPKDSLDVFVIGNSDAYSGFSPMELWHAYGYTSYVAAEGAQLITGAYSMLKNILEFHRPKLIILETDLIFTGGNKVKQFEKKANDGMKYLFPVFQYHDRWKDVGFSDMLETPEYTGSFYSKGQLISTTVKCNPNNYYKLKNQKYGHIPFTVRPILDMFINTCKASGVDLLFVQFPSASSWNDSKHKIIDEYAKRKGISFLDLDDKRDEYGLDWTTDSRDAGNHLNAFGAKKMTLYLGEYFKNDYKLQDRRADKSFNSWNENYETYCRVLKELEKSSADKDEKS